MLRLARRGASSRPATGLPGPARKPILPQWAAGFDNRIGDHPVEEVTGLLSFRHQAGAMDETRFSGRSRAGWRPRPAGVNGIGHRTWRRWRSVAAALGVRTTGTNPRWAALIGWAAVAMFLLFVAARFSEHAASFASFRYHALPAPDAVGYLAGARELAVGLLLVICLLAQLAAVALAAGMTGVIVISGLGRWELISVTLAPLRLVAMISVIRCGAGGWSPGRQQAANLASGPGPHPAHARDHLVVRPDAPGDRRRS